MLHTFTFSCFLSLVIAAALPGQLPSHGPCRFSPSYSESELAANPTGYLADVFYWEAQFHQNGIGYNTVNGLTYDGCILNQTTGFANISERHDFSAASKEVRNVLQLLYHDR